jgi:tetratricopeptide (TPR) repeat protein
LYAALMKQPPAGQGEVWYEFAAVQLLAGDAQGYRETCRRMLTLPPSAARLRPFFLARTCTLASGLFDNPALPMLLWSEDAYREARVFSSLRVQGAVQYRAGHEREAVPLFERSLQAEPKRGAAVLNWLWLSLAHNQLGDHDEARRELDEASAWLDSLGNEIPANADALLKLDLHNWLEANVLHREAELAIGSSGEKK